MGKTLVKVSENDASQIAMTERQWDFYMHMAQKCVRDFEEQVALAEAKGQPFSTSFIVSEYDRLEAQIMRQLSDFNSIDKYVVKVVYPEPDFLAGIIPPLATAAQAHLQFYCDYLEPFLHRYSGTAEDMQDPAFRDPSGAGPSSLTARINGRYLVGIHQLGGLIIKERYKAGLLRDGQMDLLRIALRSHEDALKALIKEDAPDGAALVNVVNEILRHRNLMLRFLISEEFRSERLEILLLRYLREGEVNMRLVHALDEINRDNIPDEFIERFPIIKRLYPDMPRRRPDLLGELASFQPKLVSVENLERERQKRQRRRNAQSA